ncbi:hypothetical protein N9J19_00330 [bacterium]|jgi:hypothetical protein|nr:hypothetical protein [bacterium]
MKGKSMSIKVDIRTEQEVFEYMTNVMLGEDTVQNLKIRFEDEMDGSVTFDEWVVQYMVDLVSEDEMNY